jgi:uncharacterized 2Fe-2S/4Fe-4S cluster protein (DUF4445 family)
MKKFAVNFLPSGASVTVKEGTTILKAAERAGVYLNSVCGGEGTCGKCRVKVIFGRTREPATALLTKEELADGIRLACRSSVHSPVTVEVPKETASLKTARGEQETSRRFQDHPESGFNGAGYDFDPAVAVIPLSLPPPTLEDNRDDLGRLRRGLRRQTGIKDLTAPAALLRRLPLLLREAGWEISAAVARGENRGEVIAVRPPDAPAYGLAVDIGTTTVAAHLVDLADGQTRAAGATYNSQISRGEDVIKRIISSEEDGVEPLAEAVRGDINNLIVKLAAEAEAKPEDILAVAAAGNSTMISLFLGITPRQIRREPYIPPLAGPPTLRAGEAGLEVHENAVLDCVPGIAGWVGGDITAGVLASGLDRSEELALLIDIGTNGEIVVGNRQWMLACSCSAGPAFEGSGITSGSRAVAGAIERIDLPDGLNAEWRTIGAEPPIGICGSGLLDGVAELFRAGILGRNGRFNPDHPSPALSTFDGMAAFTVVEAAQSGHGRPIVITQADIDNLIRAKAAIYAGVAVLLRAVDLSPGQLERAFISGGFGSYINIARARAIGLLPEIEPEKISFIGNGSLRGTKIFLLSRPGRRAAGRIAENATYFELSTDKNFMEEYTRAMFLPHTDVEKFDGKRS